MQVPGGAFIQAAIDTVKEPAYYEQHQKMLKEQLQEVQDAVPGQPAEFYSGYMLGIATARIMLATMPIAIINKVEL